MEPASFKTLPELVGHLRTKLSNVSPQEALDGLQEAVGPEVTIKYELIVDPNAGPAQPTKTKKSKFANVAGKKMSRILLSSSKLRADLSTELYRQLNGIVLHYPSWKVLSVPSPMFNIKPKDTELTANLDDYDIYTVTDGTVVTLYYMDAISNHGAPNQTGSWRLSSANGFDVTDYRWTASITYFEAIMEIAKKYPQFSLARLNKNCSYTIGFRHHSFHPMKADPEKLWFIQSCNLDILNNLLVTTMSTSQFLDGNVPAKTQPVLVINSTDDIGIPVQRPLIFNATDSKSVMKIMHETNENALSVFVQGTKGDFVNEPHYGFFLRPKTHRADLCDIMYESKILHLIRKTMYNFPKKRLAGEVEFTNTNRIDYAVLRAYLGVNTKYPFITLFPQYEPYYNRYTDMFNKIASRVVQLIKSRTEKPRADNVIDELSVHFADHIKESGVNVSNPEGVNIILSFLQDKRYLELYFGAVTKIRP